MHFFSCGTYVPQNVLPLSPTAIKVSYHAWPSLSGINCGISLLIRMLQKYKVENAEMVSSGFSKGNFNYFWAIYFDINSLAIRKTLNLMVACYEIANALCFIHGWKEEMRDDEKRRKIQYSSLQCVGKWKICLHVPYVSTLFVSMAMIIKVPVNED